MTAGPMGDDVPPSRRRVRVRRRTDRGPAPATTLTTPRGRLPGPAVAALVLVGYLASAQYAFLLEDPLTTGAALWPAAGVTVGAMLLLPVRRWGWVLGAAAAAELGSDLAHGLPLLPSLGWTVANCVEPLVGALLFRRVAGPEPSLIPIRRLLAFVGVAVLVGPLVGGTIGSVATVLAFDHLGWWEVWPKYVVGDALGVLVMAPVVLTARGLRGVRPSAEGLALAVVAAAVTGAVFGSPSGSWASHAAFGLVPVFLWAGLRFGVRGSAWLSLGVTLVANALTIAGRGPFAGAELPFGHAETMLQLFLGVAVGTSLVVAALMSELTDRHELERVLRRRALSDTLTGLPNRLALADAIDRALSAGTADPTRVALLVCDIDHLKLVNDTMGHAAGDELLREVARRLEAAVREGDVVARIGSDEFVVVLHDVDQERALALSERIIARVSRPVPLGPHHRTSPSLSVGLAMGERGVGAEAVYNAADAALSAAKRLGRGQTVAFDERLRLAEQARLEAERDVAGAIESGEVTCLYQPQLELASGALFGLETLARWEHPDLGVISPDRFVAAAERTGQAGPLFAGMLRRSLEAQARWAAELGVHLPVAVNLSPVQLHEPDLVGSVARALEAAGAPADALWIELTESGLAEPTALAALEGLHELGVRLALDDFGTGWSSMSRLAQVPCDVLKLDKSFVAGLGVEESADHLVQAMIVMAHALGIRTVAEGVETQRQLDRLVALGCDVVQGYLVSPPVPADRVPDLVGPGSAWRGAPPRP